MQRPHAYTQQGETLDAFALRIYGRTQGVTERLLKINGKTASQHPVLTTNSKLWLLLPSEMPTTAEKPMIKLWD